MRYELSRPSSGLTLYYASQAFHSSKSDGWELFYLYSALNRQSMVVIESLVEGGIVPVELMVSASF